jgi:hypothetical protein
MGKVLRTKGCPARANTKGRMGRMQGLRMVSAPPRYAMIRSVIIVSFKIAVQALDGDAARPAVAPI